MQNASCLKPTTERHYSNQPKQHRHLWALVALKGNLEAGGESTLTLSKTKSWFGSLRDIVQKGALQAKATVDGFRGGDQKSESKVKADDPLDLEAGPRESIDSTTKSVASSTTPLRGRHARHHSLASRMATASLRERLPSSSARHKRGSVYSIEGRPSGEISDIISPKRYDTDVEQGDTATPHKRKSSVAGSIVGSIRGLGRRAGISKHASPPSTAFPPERAAETVPLPSSPINIPVAPPALELDLGPGGFISPGFGRSPERQRNLDTLKLTDPANIATGVPKTRPVHLPVDSPVTSPSNGLIRPLIPSDLLNLPSQHFGFSPPPGPTTPMPGTNFGLEIDGTNSEKSEKTEVFERSVTPSNEKERKELRTMRSLNAMAEACRIAHANDELTEPSVRTVTEDINRAGESSAGPTTPPGLDVELSRRNGASAETVYSCPSDMPELTRQETWHDTLEHLTPFADPETTTIRASSSDDPFNGRNAVGSGPPSPTRSVELPFRPKVRTEFAATGGPADTADLGATAALAEAIAAFVDGDGHHLRDEYIEYIDRESDTVRQSSPLGSTDPREFQVQQDHAIAEGLIAILRNDSRISSPPASDGMSPHAGPLVPQLFDRIGNTQNSSPRSVRPRTTYTTGLGDTEYRFSFDNWLKESSNASAPDNEPVTPYRSRGMDMSLDSVSTSEERKTPQVSPATTDWEGTPSMGSRLEFDLKRSLRNKQYNALYHAEVLEGPAAAEASSSGRPAPRFIVRGSEETEVAGIQLADFESAYAGSREVSPTKDDKSLQPRVGSDDSVAASLKDAAFSYCQLEERLGEAPACDVDVFADPPEYDNQAEPPPSTRADPSKHTKAENLTSLSPKTESSEEFPMRTPLHPLHPRNFSPISPPDNTSPIRFTGLTVSRLSQSTTSPDSAGQLSSSSPAGPPANFYSKSHRIGSADTLDQSLLLFSSPESGYAGDKSSLSPEDKPGEESRDVVGKLRVKEKKGSGGNPLGEVSRNVV